MKKLYIIFALIFITGFSIGSYYLPVFMPFGNKTSFTDSSGYVVINKGWKVKDSLFVEKDGFIKGALYLDTNRQGKIFFNGQDMVIGNYKSGGVVSIPLPLEVSGTTSYISFPQMTGTKRDELIAVYGIDIAGMVIWNISDTKLQVWDGSTWNNMH